MRRRTACMQRMGVECEVAPSGGDMSRVVADAAASVPLINVAYLGEGRGGGGVKEGEPPQGKGAEGSPWHTRREGLLDGGEWGRWRGVRGW